MARHGSAVETMIAPAAVLAVLAVGLVGAVAARPARFWTALVAAAIVSSSAMIAGYALADEVLVPAVLAGALLVIAVRGVTVQPAAWTHAGRWVFLLLMFYLVLQSIRGLGYSGDWRISRWIVFYFALILLMVIPANWRFPTLDGRQASRVISLAGAAYMALYLLHGVTGEALRGISRWDLQGVEWAGSAYAMFPAVVIVPAALLLIRESRRLARMLGVLALLLTMAAATYYESRVAWLVILVYFAIAPVALGLRRRLIAYLVAFGALVGFISAVYQVDMVTYLRSFWESARALYAPRESDLDRQLHLVAGFRAVAETWPRLLVGAGLYAHREILGFYLEGLYGQFLQDVHLASVVRTTGLPAVLIDQGILGALALAAVGLLTAREMWIRSRGQSATRLLLMMALAMTFLWLLVSNIQDMVLFYLLIMPSGLLVQLSGPAVRFVSREQTA